MRLRVNRSSAASMLLSIAVALLVLAFALSLAEPSEVVANPSTWVFVAFAGAATYFTKERKRKLKPAQGH